MKRYIQKPTALTQADADGILHYWGQPSWFAVNRDGNPDQLDLDCVLSNLDNNCPMSGSGVNCPTPAYLANPAILPSGKLEFSFAVTPGPRFQIPATTSVSIASSNWMLLGAPTETSPGQFQFIDSQAADRPSRFFRMRTP